jgi:putative glutamine amidotransferase
MEDHHVIKIGVSMRIVEEASYSEIRDAIAHDWITFFAKEFPNIIPVFLPNSAALALKIFSALNLDGLILTGGNNLGEYPQRDDSEASLLQHCAKHLIPVLGICRGMQLIASYFQEQIKPISSANHVATEHAVQKINPSRFFSQTPQFVNSYHNQGLTQIKSNELIAIYKTSDNTIEAIEHFKLPIVGIMWHPERENQISQSDRHLIHILFFKDS